MTADTEALAKVLEGYAEAEEACGSYTQSRCLFRAAAALRAAEARIKEAEETAEAVGWDLEDWKDRAVAAEARIKALTDGIQRVINGDYPNPRDHRPGKCKHDRNYWEDCGCCADEFLSSLLAADRVALSPAPEEGAR